MRPKSPLGLERAGEPTLMPASRALKSANEFCQSSVSMMSFDVNGTENNSIFRQPEAAGVTGRGSKESPNDAGAGLERV
jgi:hypothetical protein